VMRAKLSEHLRAIRARLRISLPCIDRIALGRESELVDGLTKSTVRVARVGPKLYERPRPEDVDEEHAEGNVFSPRRHAGKSPRRGEDNAMIERVDHW
jgi:hypothetical protein